MLNCQDKAVSQDVSVDTHYRLLLGDVARLFLESAVHFCAKK